MAATKTDPEGAVRLYLMFLADPDSMRDDAAIAKAQAAVDKAKDPIDKLKALAALEKAQAVDSSSYRDDFIANAKTWADSEGIPAKAFLELGVPAPDLVAAGITTPARSKSAGTTGGRGRAPRISLDDVAAKLPNGEFRVSDLAEAIGRETQTTRNYLAKLVEAGTVADLGDDPNHDGRGKPAKLYIKA